MKPDQLSDFLDLDNPKAHSDFLNLTRQRFYAMEKRFGSLPFYLEEFRDFLVNLLGSWHGSCRCEYCNRPLTLQILELDHRTPVKEQRGSLWFDNLAPCCHNCNQQKGSMSSVAFQHLRALVNDPQKFNSVDRTDLLGRLQSQLKLAMREQARLKTQRESIRLNPLRRQTKANHD
jgi:5-methylcytosine-specific restriction endonuclease McrA